MPLRLFGIIIFILWLLAKLVILICSIPIILFVVFIQIIVDGYHNLITHLKNRKKGIWNS
jgi:hypothetical protein